MTELELKVVDRLIQNGQIKFYARYVDDTLLLVKPGDVDEILQEFNNFHNNIQFTVDKFENCVPHFLDLEVHRFTAKTHILHSSSITTATRNGIIKLHGSVP